MRGLDPVLEDGALCWERPGAGEHLLLGLEDGVGRFVAVPEDAAAAQLTGPADWRVLAALRPADAAIWGGARAVLSWHARHRFCANCGNATALGKAGWSRHCVGCGTDHFPASRPGGHHAGGARGLRAARPPAALSARAAFPRSPASSSRASRWKRRCARELMEEAGIPTAAVRYLASQPWPFPLVADGRLPGRRDWDTAITIDRDGAGRRPLVHPRPGGGRDGGRGGRRLHCAPALRHRPHAP